MWDLLHLLRAPRFAFCPPSVDGISFMTALNAFCTWNAMELCISCARAGNFQCGIPSFWPCLQTLFSSSWQQQTQGRTISCIAKAGTVWGWGCGSGSGSCCWHSPLCSWFPALVYGPHKGSEAGVCVFGPECDCELFKLCTNANRKVCKHFSCPVQAPASCAVSVSGSGALRPAVYLRVLASWHPGILALSHPVSSVLRRPKELAVRAGMLWGDICRLVDKIAEMLLLFQLIKMSSVLGTQLEKWEMWHKLKFI